VNTNPLKHQLRRRAREIAVMNGRSWNKASESDFARARQELAAQPDVDPKTKLLESVPESERWDPLPGSTGHKINVPASEGENEDDEGRSDQELLIEDGIAEAEHDQMLQASKAKPRK
jgi:hypothetical protein